MGFATHPQRQFHLRIVLIALLTVKGVFSFAQHDERSGRQTTNLDLLRLLATSLALETLRQIEPQESTHVQLSIQPNDVAWILEGGITEALRLKRLVVSQAATASYQMTFGLDEARVLYSNVRRDGIFGEKLVDRTVRMRLSAKVLKRSADGSVTLVEVQKSVTDTVALADVPLLENPVVALTKGSLPREGFFSNLVEPLIVVGSVVIAVLLLFNVRS